MPEELINGYRMYYEVHGGGPALVMVHGGLGGGDGCAAMVENHAAALSSSFQAIFYDRRAAGRSETPANGYSVDNYARDLLSLLEHLTVTRAHVLGSSAGGPIAMRFALDHPGLVESLLLINTMSYSSEPERTVRQRELDSLRANGARLGQAAAVEQALEARQPDLRQGQPQQFQHLRDLNLDRFDGIASTLQSYLDIGDSIEKRLGELRMPTLIVHGDTDSRIPVTRSHELHRGINGSELHVIPGAEHGLLTNEAEQVRGLILQFLSRLPQPAG